MFDVSVSAPGYTPTGYEFDVNTSADPYEKAEVAERTALGFSVAAAGDWIASGARSFNSAQGAVYLYHRVDGSWSPAGKLVAPIQRPVIGSGTRSHD